MKIIKFLSIFALICAFSFLTVSAYAQKLYDPRKEKNKIIVKMELLDSKKILTLVILLLQNHLMG